MPAYRVVVYIVVLFLCEFHHFSYIGKYSLILLEPVVDSSDCPHLILEGYVRYQFSKFSDPWVDATSDHGMRLK